MRYAQSGAEAATNLKGTQSDGRLSGMINELEFLTTKVEEYVARGNSATYEVSRLAGPQPLSHGPGDDPGSS